MDRQAEANRRDLPPHARATSQRLARQLMALTTSQVHALCRLRAERRKDREQAARLAREQTAAEAAAESRARIADRRALVADLERGLKAAAGASAADLAAADLEGADDAEATADPDLDALTDLALAMAAPLAPPKASPKGAAGQRTARRRAPRAATARRGRRRRAGTAARIGAAPEPPAAPGARAPAAEGEARERGGGVGPRSRGQAGGAAVLTHPKTQ